MPVLATAALSSLMVSPGGDLFALVWDAKQKKLKALNASGRAPQALNIGALKQRGFTQMPGDGIHTVTVPWLGYDAEKPRHDDARAGLATGHWIRRLHLLVEAKKLAFLDRAKHIAEPAFYQAP